MVEAARTLFRRFGVRKTSMREIAAEAGVAVGTLYLHFPSKDDLVVACVESFRAAHRRAAEALLADDRSAVARLREYLVGRFRAAQATRTQSPFAREITEAVLRVRPDRLRTELEAMRAVVRALLADGVERGELAVEDLDRDAMMLLCGTAGFFPTAVTPVAQEPDEETFVEVIDWFVRRWEERRGLPATPAAAGDAPAAATRPRG